MWHVARARLYTITFLIRFFGPISDTMCDVPLHFLLSSHTIAHPRRVAPSTTPASTRRRCTATPSCSPCRSRPRDFQPPRPALPLALDDCMFHTFRRIPVWEYQTDQQLLKGLLDALAGMPIRFALVLGYRAYLANATLQRTGPYATRASCMAASTPRLYFLVEAAAGSEQGTAGFLDATHIEEGAVAASRSVAAVNDTDTVRASSPVSYVAAQR